MLDILVRGAVIYTGNEIIRDGYVYIRGGRITGLGEGTAPEDYTYAALILGGPGRIVAPGLAAVIDAPAYPIRFYRPTMEKRVKYYKAMGLDALAAVSLPAVYEAHLSGVTTIIVEAIEPQLPQRLADTLGGLYGIAYPACVSERLNREQVPGLAVVATVGDESCPEADVDYRDNEVLVLSGRLSYTLHNEPRVYERSAETRRRLGLEEQGIKEGRLAEIAVFDTSRPPAMLLEYAPDNVIPMVYSAARVETLLVGDHVLVDGGEHLYIVEKSFSQARNIASRILGKSPSSLDQ